MFSRWLESKLTGWNGDNGVRDLLSKVCFGRLLHLAKDHCRNFLWGLKDKG
jgi:NAD-specific glutamate dehydrogenase